MTDKSLGFSACLIYDLIFMAMLFYLIAWMGWSKWSYILGILNGGGVMGFYYKAFGKYENNTKSN